jgi:hypothetical protein
VVLTSGGTLRTTVNTQNVLHIQNQCEYGIKEMHETFQFGKPYGRSTRYIQEDNIERDMKA